MSTIEFEQHVVGLRRQMLWFALSLTRDREAARDLVQDSMLRALTFREHFQDGTNLKAWLFTIMRNTFINGHRREARKRAVIEQVRSTGPAFAVPGAAHSESGLLRREIEGGLSRLDPAFRHPFLLHHEGYKYEEISDRLAIPLGTVKSRIHEARRRLTRMLSENRA